MANGFEAWIRDSWGAGWQTQWSKLSAAQQKYYRDYYDYYTITLPESIREGVRGQVTESIQQQLVPPSTLGGEDQTTNAFLLELEKWLKYRVSIGEIREADIDPIQSDYIARMYGIKPYTEQTPIFALPQYNKIITFKKDIEADIAKQKQIFPLGGGGTGAEQIWQAEWAIRDLQTQFNAAPDYLKPTIQGQIQTLKDFQTQQKKTERTLASGNLPQELTPEEARRYTIGQEEARAGMFATDFAKEYGMSVHAAMQAGLRYAQHPESPEFSNLTQKEKVDLAWVGMEVAPESPPAKKIIPPYKPPATFGEAGITGSQYYKNWFEGKYSSALQEYKTTGAQTEAGWAGLVGKKKEEWWSLGWRERGERPYAFQPPIETKVAP